MYVCMYVCICYNTPRSAVADLQLRRAKAHSAREWSNCKSATSLHDRVVKKGVSFLRGNVSIITSSDLSHMHVISMNVILPPRRREG